MLIVKVDNGDKKGDIEKALKVYKNKTKSVKLYNELRERREFVKPSVAKRKEKQKAIYVEKKYDSNETE